MTRAKLVLRLVFTLLVVATVATLVTGYATSSHSPAEGHIAGGQTVAPPRENVTVIATDSNSWLGAGRSGPRAKAELFAVGPEGGVVYYNDSHTRYWDVDPVAGTKLTVEYLFADHLPPEVCSGEQACTRNGIERVNLSTGAVTRVFSRVTPGKHATRWHDADRIDDHHVAVADIDQDRVFVVNTTSDLVTWAWSAQSEYPVAASGGPYPDDWTHLNDVEVLDDGRIMASLRNHDQVVFLDRERGLVENWTLGADDEHDVLFEQHNPDYIPAGSGGPAVVVADSENNRVVEYQRVDSEWTRTWTWYDDGLQWPRDADRLPNGHTLVTDSNGNRVVEVDDDGEVVWSVKVAFPYEAERLGTGPESAGGPSAREAGLTGLKEASAVADVDNTESAGIFAPVEHMVQRAFHGPTTNAVLYVLPVWVGTVELGALVVLLVTLSGWATTEWYWSSWRFSVRSPVIFGGDRGD